MKEYERFVITHDHIKLLQNMYFSYDEGGEFGAPAVNSKRPYGNSNVYDDIGEIIEELPELVDCYGDEVYSDDQTARFLKIHKEMTTVLNIIAATCMVESGEYQKEKYTNNWEPAP